MSEKFMVFVAGKAPGGPFDIAELERRLGLEAHGAEALPETTKVCRVGGEQWVPIRSVVVPKVVPVIVADTATPNASSPQSQRVVHPRAKRIGAAVAVAALAVTVIAAVAAPKLSHLPDSYIECHSKANSADVEKVLAACTSAAAEKPGTALARLATLRMEELKARQQQVAEAQAAEAERARIAQVEAARERWANMPKTLADKIRKQGWLDIGRGTVTNAMDVIIQEIGNPSATYEAAFGSIHNHVWGGDLGSSATEEQIRAAPFNIMILRDLKCGDYGGGEIEFYSNGKKLSP